MRWTIAALLALSLGLSVASADKGGRAAELLEKADAVTAEVEKLRGLKRKGPITKGSMNKEQIRQRILERVNEEYAPEEIAGEGLALKRLGLLPADMDYLDAVVGLLTDQIAGFYDPFEKQLYLASWTQMGEDMLIAHEIDHALQDQHFDLEKFMKADKTNADATVARQALVEGDGTALMLEYTMKKSGQQVPWGNDTFVTTFQNSLDPAAMGDLADAPIVLREGLTFPYMGGLAFIAHFRAHHPWSAIDDIYRKPPLSTEQILHPEKYESYERPVKIAASIPPSLSGYQKVYDNVEGEMAMRIFFRQHRLPTEKAELAARGWGGDRIAVFVPPGHNGNLGGSVAAMHLVWDDEADAIEFFEGVVDALPRMARSRGILHSSTYVEHRIKGEGSLASVQRRGDAVVMVIGAPPARAEDVLDDVWAWKVTR